MRNSPGSRRRDPRCWPTSRTSSRTSESARWPQAWTSSYRARGSPARALRSSPRCSLLRVDLAKLVADRVGPAPERLDRRAALADLTQHELAGDPGVVQEAER